MEFHLRLRGLRRHLGRLKPPQVQAYSYVPDFGGSRSFKVIDVGTTGKLVGSACYDKQQVCVYLQPFSR